MASQNLNVALAAHQTGKLDEAEEAYLRILKTDPDNSDALCLLSILYGQQQKYTQALPYIEKALKISPNNASYHNSMGNIKKKLHDLDAAVHHYQNALRIDPKNISTLNNLGSICFEQNKLDEAKKYYEEVLAINPNFLDTNYNLALNYYKQNDLEGAKKYLRKTIEIDKNHFQALTLLGNIAFTENNFDDAIQLLTRSVYIYDQDVTSLVNLGASLVKTGKLEEALPYLKHAAELDPHHFEAHYNLGCIYINLRDSQNALIHFMHILTKDPNPDVYYNIGVIYMYQDRYSEAITYLQEAVKYKPDFLDALVNLGVTFLKLGHHDKAVDYFEKVLVLQPNNIEVKYILSALQGDQLPQRAPHEYVEHLFDQYAPYYDKHLLTFLHYETHNLLHTALNIALGEQLHDLMIIDLGCGTGLTGELLKPYARKLIGIDLSAKMIEMAGKKNIYDDLHIADIHTTLKSITQADLIIAGDVISYLGDLNETFSLVQKALKNSGFFAFSAELLIDSDKDFVLQKTARFQHNEHYFDRLIKEYQFDVIYHEEVVLRTQNNKPVSGVIFVLKGSSPDM